MTENINPKQHDADTRLPVGLCPPILTIRVAAVLRWGANKVGRWRWNWRDNPIQLTTYLDAIERHLMAVRAGEELDPETGEPHLAHIAANCGIIMDAQLAGTLVDDRPKNNPSVAGVLKEYSDRFKSAQQTPSPAELEQRAQIAMKTLTQLEEHRGIILAQTNESEWSRIAREVAADKLKDFPAALQQAEDAKRRELIKQDAADGYPCVFPLCTADRCVSARARKAGL